jgi:UDP-glucose 4-epimerase
VEIKKKNLEGLKKNKHFEFVFGSILDDTVLEKISKDVDLVYHLAAIAGVRNSIEEPVKYCDFDVLGTVKMLDKFRRKDIEKFVSASSSSVYGEVPEKELPVKEDRAPKPIAPYALSKLQAEEWCDMFNDTYGLPTVSLRYFTVYGPRQRPDEAFTRFISVILKNKKLEIYGDGKQTRDFSFVGDIVDGTILAGEKGDGIYNVSSGKRVTLNDAIDTIFRLVGKKPDVKHLERQATDVTHTWADITRIKKLGYSPKTTLEEGLKKQVEWCRLNLSYL